MNVDEGDVEEVEGRRWKKQKKKKTTNCECPNDMA
jgi:hypothetical protein